MLILNLRLSYPFYQVFLQQTLLCEQKLLKCHGHIFYKILYSSFLSFVSPWNFYSITDISFLQDKKWVITKQNLSRARKKFES